MAFLANIQCFLAGHKHGLSIRGDPSPLVSTYLLLLIQNEYYQRCFFTYAPVCHTLALIITPFYVYITPFAVIEAKKQYALIQEHVKVLYNSVIQQCYIILKCYNR